MYKRQVQWEAAHRLPGRTVLLGIRNDGDDRAVGSLNIDKLDVGIPNIEVIFGEPLKRKVDVESGRQVDCLADAAADILIWVRGCQPNAR